MERTEQAPKTIEYHGEKGQELNRSPTLPIEIVGRRSGAMPTVVTPDNARNDVGVNGLSSINNNNIHTAKLE